MIINRELNFPIINEFRTPGRHPTTLRCISALLYLIDKYSIGNIFEIGSWFGKTTYELATRLPERMIYTIDYIGDDLQLDPNINRGLITNKEDLCKYAKDLPNVQFFFENSFHFDFDKLYDVDFIFIDGSHELDGIDIDTENSIDYLKENNGGIIAYHDIRVGHTDVGEYMKYMSDKIEVNYINNFNIGYIIINKDKK